MKTKNPLLIFIGCLFCATNLVAQVGIGTPLPNASAQLDVVANNKGVLIPRLALLNSADAVTIEQGNVPSLLVYNTETIADITPGFHYWDGDKWQRIINQEDVAGLETLTTLADNLDGTLTYTDEDGVPNIVTITTIASNVLIEDGTIDIDGDGIPDNDITLKDVIDNINNIVAVNETLTTLVDNGDGTYTYTSEDDTTTNIDGVQTGTGDPNTNGTTGMAGDIYVDESTGDIYTYDGTIWINQTSPGFSEVVIMAIDGQTNFTPPLPATATELINVFRNGVRIGFSIVNESTLQLEPEATCYANDEIRIVQVAN